MGLLHLSVGALPEAQGSFLLLSWVLGFCSFISVPSFRDSPQQTLSLRNILGSSPVKIVLLYYPVMFW